MGTTAEKGAYLKNTKSLLKQKINNLGRDITSETTFRQYAEELQNVYDRLPKTEYQEGTEITLSNTLKGKLDFEKIYQQVEYITSDGNSYIDTLIALGNNFEIDFSFISNQTTTGEQPIVSNWNATHNYWNFFIRSNSQVDFYVKGHNFFNLATAEVGQRNDMNIKRNGNTFTAVYNEITTTVTNDTLTDNNTTLKILNRGDAQGTSYASIGIVKIYKDNVLQRNLIPCYRISDNVIGMYDLVNNKFYTNAGTGTFTKGADVGNGFIEKISYGDTYQVSTNGYNLFNITDYSTSNEFSINYATNVVKTKNSVSFYCPAKMNGVYVNRGYISNVIDNFNSDTTYYISVDVEVESASKIYFGSGQLEVYNLSPGKQRITKYTKCSNSNGLEGIYFYNFNDGAGSFKISNIMVSTSNNDFEPYTNGPAPNPSYSQEIEVVRGKNLFKPQELTEITNNGITFTPHYENGILQYINVNGTATGVATYNLQGGNVDIASTFPNSLSKGEYTLSDFTNFSSATKAIYLRYTYDGQTYQGIHSDAKDITFTLTENAKYATYIRIQNTVEMNNIKFYPMLVKGSQAASYYLPYNTIEEVVSGKNEADPNNIILGKSLGTSGELTPMTTRATLFKNSIKPNTQYHLSIDNNYQIGNLFYYNKDKTYLTVHGSAWENNKTTITPSNAYYISFATKKIDDTTMTESDIEKLQIQIEEGSTATTYEPYQTPQTYQLSLGEYEFAKIGNYVDTIEYDVDEDKVYKNKAINKVLLKTLTWENATVGTNTYGTLNLINTIGKATREINIICSHAVGILFTDRNWFTNTTIYAETNGYVNFRNTSFTSLKEFTTFLSNNNVYAYYVLATSTKEEITGTLKDQIKEWYNSHSFTGTTIITSNGELPLVLKVRALKAS